MQFVRVFPTWPQADGQRLQDKINEVLEENQSAKVVSVLSIPIQKIGGVDIQALIVFEDAQSED